MPATLCVPLRRSRSCPPAEDEWSKAIAGPHRQHTDSLGATELVSTERQAVDVRPDRAEIEPARGLHGIGVHERLRSEFPHDAGDRREIGHHTGLVVDRHDRDARDRAFLEDLFEMCEVGLTRGRHANDPTVQVFDGMQHRMVFGGHAHRSTST